MLVRGLIKSLVSTTVTTVSYHGCRVPAARAANDWPNQSLINCEIERMHDRRTGAGVVTGVTVILDLIAATFSDFSQSSLLQASHRIIVL